MDYFPIYRKDPILRKSDCADLTLLFIFSKNVACTVSPNVSSICQQHFCETDKRLRIPGDCWLLQGRGFHTLTSVLPFRGARSCYMGSPGLQQQVVLRQEASPLPHSHGGHKHFASRLLQTLPLFSNNAVNYRTRQKIQGLSDWGQSGL